ncbi:ABC transporter ATP-binding protein [uncultured Deinococcus sp.]|uniref:ABC transporter ATP-binding protein n=1 Tax=uncultured Deinococcus sp. TaxID=158789 RepID=UPI0025835A8B|nr:ABC transporter ATP-binding protein [uncultured Deinococcus sp.]
MTASATVVAPTVLEARHMTRRFGGLVAVNDVSFDVREGEIFGLIGPNGAGKTTLINLLTGVLKPSQGRVELDGQDVTVWSPDARVRRGLARTFQINALFPRLTPLQSVLLALAERERIGAVWWKPVARYRPLHDEAERLLTLLRLDDLAHVPVAELAYGKQRLLEIALAMATRPRVLLLDEPAAGVPKDESGEIFDAVASLPADVAVLFIEHDMQLVFRFARRISVLVAGQLLTEGTPAEIAADPRVREVYLGRAHAHLPVARTQEPAHG